MAERVAALALLAASLLAPAARAEVVCTAVADAQSGKVLLAQGDCSRRVAPMSTFKIAIALMGFDAGVLKDEHTPALPFEPGYPDWIASWRATTDPTSWIANSVVWYSQQVTARLGEARFAGYVRAFGYGNEDVSGDPGKYNGLRWAWLSSSLQISPLEQLRFLERLTERRLGVSAHAYVMTDRITYVAALPDGWRINGKTGTGAPQRADGSKDQGHELGWFVGWAKKGHWTLVFARLIEAPANGEPRAGLKARADFLEQAPALLDPLG
jgi:beta-lactamase class D